MRLMLLVCAATLYAQAPPAITRTVLQTHDTSGANQMVVMAKVEVIPGAFAGRHTHPGEEITYVLDGDAEILIEGKPAQRVKAGDSFFIPAGVPHDAHNLGAAPLRMVGTYIVEKGKPLATPAPRN